MIGASWFVPWPADDCLLRRVNLLRRFERFRAGLSRSGRTMGLRDWESNLSLKTYPDDEEEQRDGYAAP